MGAQLHRAERNADWNATIESFRHCSWLIVTKAA
jgi:hypothetical protein